jgi:hypothetical protein
LLRLPAVGDNAAMQSDSPKADPPKRKRRWFQFSLRSVLIAVTLLALACGWLGQKIDQKRKEREALEAIFKSGGDASYDFDIRKGRRATDSTPPGQEWLRDLLGDNFFSEVVKVSYQGEFDSVKRRGGNVTDEALVNLKALPKLRTLYLDFTPKLTDAGLANLNELKQLQALYLGRMRASDAGMENLKRLTQLQSLALVSTDVTDAGLASLKGLTQLRWLNLSNSKVTDAGLANLKELTQLRSLYLDSTVVTDAGIENLSGLTKLHDLGLARTQVSDTGLASLKGFSKLRRLALSETTVTDAGINVLQKALPHCKIEH